MTQSTEAFWVIAPGQGEIRSEALRDPGAGEVLVRALYSAVSRGTESLVWRAEVPESEFQRMRAPFQQGEFPFPVKYGYASVGVVESGDPALVGRTVFCLFPHQTRYVVPVSAVTVVPEGIPDSRAVLAGTVETAVNALWDAAPLVGDRVAIVGAGMVGCAIAGVLGHFPGVDVTLVDVAPLGVQLINERGVVHGGVQYDLDVLIYATGFDFMSRENVARVTGSDGLCGVPVAVSTDTAMMSTTKMSVSPTAMSRGMRLPLSSMRPGPVASTLPSCGFSLAVSGMTSPEAVVFSASSGWTRMRSSSGLIVTATSKPFRSCGPSALSGQVFTRPRCRRGATVALAHSTGEC